MIRKPLVVTFRLDEATRDRIREPARHSPHRTSSALIRKAITQLLRREEERPSGWTVLPQRATDREILLGVSQGTQWTWVPLKAPDGCSSGRTGSRCPGIIDSIGSGR